MASVGPRYDKEENLIGWQARVIRKGYPTRSKTFRGKKEAEAWARSIESEMDKGVWRDTSAAERTTLEETLNRYAEEIIPTKKGDGAREIGFLRQWQARPIACRFMAAIDGQDVTASIKEMEGEGKGANTIRLHLALLSHLFEVARKEWRMSSLVNPVELVRKPKLPQGRDRRLVGDEEVRLVAECRAISPELAAIAVIAIETAMRQGEIMSLIWDKIDLAKRTVMLDNTKNGDKRIVPLSSKAVEALRVLPRRLDGKVWTYSDDGMRTGYKRACKRADIIGLTFHDLRHEATSRLFEKGFNPVEVSAITGHKTLQMLKRYTHLRAEDLAKRMG
ncbi:site-specific integrase [Acidithiobacillus ferrooxidans]|nr:site-specific integrase [Acidithiobacillus ferrooxidans]